MGSEALAMGSRIDFDHHAIDFEIEVVAFRIPFVADLQDFIDGLAVRAMRAGWQAVRTQMLQGLPVGGEFDAVQRRDVVEHDVELPPGDLAGDHPFADGRLHERLAALVTIGEIQRGGEDADVREGLG